jgi:DNA-binding GntR family transcriptional regulator
MAISADADDGVPSAPLATGVATQTVHNELRRLILEGKLAPGAELSQLELSRQLNVSRTPLREALRLLEREGLVVSGGPHRLVTVSALSMTDLDSLYSMRTMLESLCIWLTVPALRDDDFARMEEDLRGTHLKDPQLSQEAHRRFHAVLRVGAEGRLSEQAERLFEHAERYQLAYTRRDVTLLDVKHKEHEAILEACRQRDREQARDLIVDHVADTAMVLMTSERHAPFVLPTAVKMAKAAG